MVYFAFWLGTTHLPRGWSSLWLLPAVAQPYQLHSVLKSTSHEHYKLHLTICQYNELSRWHGVLWRSFFRAYKHKQSVIYKVVRNQCDKLYIWQTGRNFKTRYKNICKLNTTQKTLNMVNMYWVQEDKLAVPTMMPKVYRNNITYINTIRIRRR
jgi:hypothetical protein